ncbi:MAG TPA: NAD(P)-binding domain-containing protein [Ktedonobacterales bacterium]
MARSTTSSRTAPITPAGSPALPVAIVGAGPVGLAAAAHLLGRGETPLVLEVGEAAGANVAQWAHVRFFSPWKYSVDVASRDLLEAHGWTMPDPDDFPTGRALLDRYLLPLAALPELAPHIRYGARVVSVARRGYDKMKTLGRDEAPFVVTIQRAGGDEEQAILARAVIDASGTWTSPNPLGASGVPALGERALGAHIGYGIPDVLGADRVRYAGRRVLVAGSGHSAFNTIVDLAALAQTEPGTHVIWVIRRAANQQLYGGGTDDELPARGALGQQVRALVEADALRLVTGFKALALRETDTGIAVSGERDGAEETLPPVDELIVATGFRPDLIPLAELRLALDPATESPAALAPLIDPNVHSCGTVPPHSAIELAHPEQDFYLAGMKSYGRAPTFLLLTGYEQVRSIAAALAGDWEAARDVQLVLPETGVCSSSYGQGSGGSCCGVGAACGDEAADTAEPAVTAAVTGTIAAPRRSGKPLGVPVVSVAAGADVATAPARGKQSSSCCG